MTALLVGQSGPPLVPLRRLLVGIRRLQQTNPVPGSGGQLQADRQPAFCKSARNRDRGNSPNIEGTRIPEHDQFLRTQVVGIRLQVSDGGWWNRDGGCQKNVHFIEYFLNRVTAGLEFAAGT